MNMHHQLEKKDEDSAEDVEDLEERYDRIWLRRICRVRARIEIVLLQFLHRTVVQKEWNSRDAVGRQARLSLSLLRAFTLQNQHSSQTSTLMRPWADRWRWEGQTSLPIFILEGSDRKNDWLLECRAIYSRNHPGPNPLSSFLKKCINDRSTEGKEYQNWDAWTRCFRFHWLVGLHFWSRSRDGRNIEGGRNHPVPQPPEDLEQPDTSQVR